MKKSTTLDVEPKNIPSGPIMEIATDKEQLSDRIGKISKEKKVAQSQNTKETQVSIPKQGSTLVVVANRLPVDSQVEDDGTISWKRSPGGLVTALEPILKKREGAWIGWSGGSHETPECIEEDNMRLLSVHLTEEEVESYYEGFSNSTLWPLYHDAMVTPTYDRHSWDSYVKVNRRFAEKAAKETAKGGTVFVQDYQLQLVPKLLREMRPDVKIGFFLHIPFPPKELFFQLPWRKAIVEGLLGADLIGFQVKGAAKNFLDLTEELLGLSPDDTSVKVADGRKVRVGAFPISINANEYDELARSREVEELMQQNRENMGSDRRIILGVDRLDYTKGIEKRLKVYRELLADGIIDPSEVTLVQVAPPSRERVDHYVSLREDVEREVGSINGEYGHLGFPAVHYIHRSMNRTELTALYRIADVMLVTPIKDGMNLVCKEYIASRVHNDGTLVLSEFAGAAEELKQSYLCNPHDIDGMKEIVSEAWNATPEEQEKRMTALREQVFSCDIDCWAQEILSALGVE